MKATAYHSGRALAEHELLPPAEACPICHSTGPRRAVHRIQQAPVVDLLACARCHGASAARMPRPEVLDAYYRDYYAGRATHVTVADPARFAAQIVRHLRFPSGSERVRLLDFGGGDGGLGASVAAELLSQGRARRVDIVLVDYEPPQPIADDAITIVGRRTLEEVDERFDVVLASAILEHVPELHAVARRLFARVASGGSLYARTPWLAPLAALVPSLDLTFPAHVHDLGGDFWNRVVETFELDAELAVSGPSPVESSLKSDPLRAAVAHLLKAPARVEVRLRGAVRGADPLWRWVGGWEALLRFS